MRNATGWDFFWSLAKRWQRSKKIGHLPLLVLYSFVERDPSHVNELAAEQMLLYRKLETNQNHCRFVLMIFVQ